MAWSSLVLFAGIGWGLWLDSRLVNSGLAVTNSRSPILDTTTAAPNREFSPIHPNANEPASGVPSREEWQAYSSDRQKILQQDPALAVEYQGLLEEIKAQREKLNAAMIQADPKAAPIIAKLEAMQKRSMVQSPPASTPSGKNVSQ